MTSFAAVRGLPRGVGQLGRRSRPSLPAERGRSRFKLRSAGRIAEHAGGAARRAASEGTATTSSVALGSCHAGPQRRIVVVAGLEPRPPGQQVALGISAQRAATTCPGRTIRRCSGRPDGKPATCSPKVASTWADQCGQPLGGLRDDRPARATTAPDVRRGPPCQTMRSSGCKSYHHAGGPIPDAGQEQGLPGWLPTRFGIGGRRSPSRTASPGLGQGRSMESSRNSRPRRRPRRICGWKAPGGRPKSGRLPARGGRRPTCKFRAGVA